MATDGAEAGAAAAPAPSSPVRLSITVYTDPLCCWSWGLEPQLRRLRAGYAGRIAWRMVLGAMVEDWSRFSDPLNAVHRPVQMGPLWIQAREITGMPIDPDIWITDPPGSSIPPSRAVKAAGLQSAVLADKLLRRLREALMVDGRNIARADVIDDVAAELAREASSGFDLDRFRADIASAASLEALREDVAEVRLARIGRFPTLAIRAPGAPPQYLTGWRPAEAIEAAIREAVPDLGPPRAPGSAEAVATYWGSALPREIEEALRPSGAAGADVSAVAHPSSAAPGSG